MLRFSFLAMALAVSPASCSEAKQPRWSTTALVDLVQVAATAPEQGLPSEAVAASEIRAMIQQAKRDPIAAARLEAAADALYARLARSFGQGAVDPAVVDPEWRIPRAEVLEADTTWNATTKNARPSSLLIPLLPTTHEYEVLQQEYLRVSAEPEGGVDANGRSRGERLASLRASLERWRWLPRGLGPTRVEARVPQFEVVLHMEDAPPAAFNAIVGARRTQTPTFAGAIEGVTLNPTWTPPRSILVNELLPQMRRNARARDDYQVIDARGQIVDPAAVDWSAQPFPYQLRQPAGAANALGQIKFEMPNRYDVYLHDTPGRALFARSQRALSHGCIRVERPVELAAALLAPVWDAAALDSAIAAGGTQSIELPAPIPFYALYITASGWDGVVSYADDVYGRDSAVIAALDAPASAADIALAAADPASPTLRCPP